MNLKTAFVIIISIAVAGIGGWLLGLILQFDSIIIPPPAAQASPRPISPENGIEFVESDLWLEWSWAPELTDIQRYVVRIWTQDKPHQEIWTVDNRLSIQTAIDSFSVAVGRYFWQAAVVNVNADGAFESMGSEWSETFELRRVRRYSIPARAYADMSAAARHFHDLRLSVSDTIDAVHRFIHNSSLTDEQLSYAPDYSDAIDLMFNYTQGYSDEQPLLQCDGRSTAMLTILQELGVESRLVFLYRPAPGWLSQHTVLEVFNPDTQRWQVHDLGSSDFYYVEADSMERVSAERILFGSLDTLLGCPIAGGPCTVEGMQKKHEYFRALRYGYTYEIWVNPDRFEVSTRFEGQGGRNLAEFIGDGWPQRVTIRMDSWENAGG